MSEESKRKSYSLIAFPYALMVSSHDGMFARSYRYRDSSEVMAPAQLLGLPPAEVEEIRAAHVLGLVVSLTDVRLTPEQLLWFDEPTALTPA